MGEKKTGELSKLVNRESSVQLNWCLVIVRCLSKEKPSELEHPSLPHSGTFYLKYK